MKAVAKERKGLRHRKKRKADENDLNGAGANGQQVNRKAGRFVISQSHYTSI